MKNLCVISLQKVGHLPLQNLMLDHPIETSTIQPIDGNLVAENNFGYLKLMENLNFIT